jgi:hypothetical protein
MINWDKYNPDFVPMTSGGSIHMERTGGPGSTAVRTGFSFNNLPANATGCMLQFEYPSVWLKDLFATGANNFDVFASETPIAYGTSWDTQPGKAGFLTSGNVAEWITTEEFKTNLWSTSSCGPGLSFIIELSDWQQDYGRIEMLNGGFTSMPIAINSGFSIIYYC